MRKLAILTPANGVFVRAMIYDPADGRGVYLFLFRCPDDGPCEADHWCEDVQTAERLASEAFGIEPTDWQPIPDPQPGCQHDRIAAVPFSHPALPA